MRYCTQKNIKYFERKQKYVHWKNKTRWFNRVISSKRNLVNRVNFNIFLTGKCYELMSSKNVWNRKLKKSKFFKFFIWNEKYFDQMI